MDPNNSTSVKNSLTFSLSDIKFDATKVSFEQSTGTIMFSAWSSAAECIYANNRSYINITSNSGTCTSKVLESNYASTIVKIGAVGITGGTAETVSNGGLIR